MKTRSIFLSLFLFLIVAGCNQQNRLMVIAHRGASGYETENTLAAIQKAIELKSDAFEVDVWRTIDDSLVVFHDANTQRLAGDSLVISQSTYAQLRALLLPGDQYIPTLREVLELMPGDIKIVIEIKNCWEPGKAGELFPELGELLKETGTLGQAILISFNIEKLKEAKELVPGVPLLWLTYEKQPADTLVNIALKAEVDGINVHHGLVSDELVEAARANDLGFFVWTVNEPELAKVLGEKYKVDGITTNFPDVIAAAVGQGL
jgi:glycerophosphoryl diester phosphodiesterase